MLEAISFFQFITKRLNLPLLWLCDPPNITNVGRCHEQASARPRTKKNKSAVRRARREGGRRSSGLGMRVLSWVSPAETDAPPAKGGARFRGLRRREEDGGGREEDTRLAGGATAGKRATQSRASVRGVVLVTPAALVN
jgi:hypothetical protein